MIDSLRSLIGLFGLVLIAWILGGARRPVPWRVIGWGLALQLGLGLLILSPAAQDWFFVGVDTAVRRLLSFGEAGANFVFQSIQPHQILDPAGVATTYVGRISPPVKTFAFWVLPSIIFFSSLAAVGYHIGVLQYGVRAMAWLMQRTMGTSGAETLSTAANVFLGQTEAPILVKPFLARMTRSELFCVMLGGFANTSGSILGLYVGFLGSMPGIAGHLVTCSLLSAPATLVVAKAMMPEDGVPETASDLPLSDARPDANVMQAAARGASEGMALALNVAAMLIAFVALVAMVDAALSLVPVGFCQDGVTFGWTAGCEPLSLARMLGWVFAPVAFLLGVGWDESGTVGYLLGEKLVLTEVNAYAHLGTIMATDPLSDRAALLASYALCGFANFASVGIQLGGIGGMAPNRMGDLAALGFRAMIGGTIATLMTAAVAGVFL